MHNVDLRSPGGSLRSDDKIRSIIEANIEANSQTAEAFHDKNRGVRNSITRKSDPRHRGRTLKEKNKLMEIVPSDINMIMSHRYVVDELDSFDEEEDLDASADQIIARSVD